MSARHHNRNRNNQGPGRQDQNRPRQERGPQRNEPNVRQTPSQPEPPAVQEKEHTPRRYAVVIYDTIMTARADLEKLREMARGVDQLNIVIRVEAPQDDPELGAVGKVFAGKAWTSIHERRIQEGWYNEPR